VERGEIVNNCGGDFCRFEWFELVYPLAEMAAATGKAKKWGAHEEEGENEGEDVFEVECVRKHSVVCPPYSTRVTL
jgi:hypothetical protein